MRRSESNIHTTMKKYRYTFPGAWLATLTKWSETNGLEESNSYCPGRLNWILEFDTLKELESMLNDRLYWVDFNVDCSDADDSIIFVHWYTTKNDIPVKPGDKEWEEWGRGERELWEYHCNIMPHEIYLNQTIKSFDEIQA